MFDVHVVKTVLAVTVEFLAGVSCQQIRFQLTSLSLPMTSYSLQANKT